MAPRRITQHDSGVSSQLLEAPRAVMKHASHRRRRAKKRATAPVRSPGRPIWKRVVRSFVFFVAASVLAIVLSRLGPVHVMERMVMEGRARLARGGTSPAVVAVEITDEDYERK